MTSYRCRHRRFSIVRTSSTVANQPRYRSSAGSSARHGSDRSDCTIRQGDLGEEFMEGRLLFRFRAELPKSERPGDESAKDGFGIQPCFIPSELLLCHVLHASFFCRDQRGSLLERRDIEGACFVRF